jgi:hypothetical protein
MTNPTVVCAGWTQPQHDLLVMTPGDPSLPVSHGMCPVCVEAMNVQMDTHEKFVVAKVDPRR